MRNFGLYYPYMHPRDDYWLTLAALYWTRLARAIPPGYQEDDAIHHSRLLQVLNDGLDFILDIDVTPAVRQIEGTFLDVVLSYGGELHMKLGSSNGGHYDGAGMYFTEIGPRLQEALESEGLATPPSGHYHGRVARPEWVWMPERLAMAYSAAMADALARMNSLEPVTDDPAIFAATSNWTVDHILSELLGGSSSEKNPPISAPAHHSDPLLVVELAIEAVVPLERGSTLLSFDIVKLRQRHGADFDAFRTEIDSITEDLTANLPSITDGVVLEAYIRDEIDRRLMRPLRELKAAARGLRLETVKGTLSLLFTTPMIAATGVAALAGAPQHAVAGGALASATIGLLLESKERRRQVRGPSAAGYLLAASRSVEHRGW